MNARPNPAAGLSSDQEFLLALLRESQEKFLGSFASVSDEQSRLRPTADCWSVLDTVERIAAAETVLLNLVTTQRRLRSADAPNREQLLLRVVPNRSRKLQSPESARPRGRFASLHEAAGHFRTTREGAIHFVEQHAEHLRTTEVTHPHSAVGVVSTYEMLIIIAKHAERHALQIAEIRNTLGIDNSMFVVE
jgi:hypothetical protein